jgi:hypothetical protein
MSSLATLVGMDGNSVMIVEELNILQISGIALILALLTARTATGLESGFFKAFLIGRLFANDRDADRMFEKGHIQALKKCPNCSEQSPLSALICEPCDYNFLSGMVGHGHKLLPSPEPRVHEMPTQIFAYRG